MHSTSSQAGKPHGEEEECSVDSILSDAVGEFGRYQLIALLVYSLSMLFGASLNYEYVFTTARIKTRCLIPECDEANPEFAPNWILNATPASGATFDGCSRYGSSVGLSNTVDKCPASLFDNSTVEKCGAWVYENHNSIVSEFDLGCDEWKRSLVGSVRTFGTLVSMSITGYLSDRFGRRPMLLFNTINVLWIGLLRSWSNSYWMFVLLEFAEAALGFAWYTCSFLIVLELFGPKYRLAVGAAASSATSIGQVWLAFLAWRIPYWRNFTRVLFSHQLVPIIIALLSTESVRWLMINGRYEEGKNILVKIAQVNRTSLPEKTLLQLKQKIENDTANKIVTQSLKQPLLPVLIWNHKPILKRCLIAPLLWIAMTLTLYGISLNAVNLTGSPFVNYAAVCAVEVPGHWTAYFAVHVIGSKLLLMLAYWLCAACMAATVFITSDRAWVSLSLTLLGKYAIAVVLGAIYVYTAEIFPTSHRHTLFSFCSMVGRIGSIIAPLTPALGALIWSELPYALFAGCCGLSGALMCFMPETMGTRLPDTMDQVEH